MKNKLMKMLATKNERKAAITKQSEASNDVAEVRGLIAELDTINAEIRSIEEMIVALPDEPTAGEERTIVVTGGAPGVVISSAEIPKEKRTEMPDDKYGTLEYRTAFMKFARTGEVTPELRLDAMTTVSEVTAVVPTTILNEVISKITTYGQIYARIRKLAIKGGVDVPILTLKPTATWITEAATSEKKKVTANTKISFSYYGLECKVAVSLLADTVTLAGFETTVVSLIAEAITKAIDIAIVKGSGSGAPLGITIDSRVPVANVITLSSSEFGEWDAWKKKVTSKMPMAYKAGAVWMMASGTYEGYIDGMTDANGQPVGRTNYGIADGPQGRFSGKEVVEVEDDVIASYDDASTGDVVAILMNLSNYAFNSNMQLSMFRYFDHDTNEWVDKAILIADGKLIDPNGVIIVKKGA